jgi:hypothetical protein
MKPLSVDGQNLLSAIEVLVPAQHLSASGPLPPGRMVLSFSVNAGRYRLG